MHIHTYARRVNIYEYIGSVLQGQARAQKYSADLKKACPTATCTPWGSTYVYVYICVHVCMHRCMFNSIPLTFGSNLCVEHNRDFSHGLYGCVGGKARYVLHRNWIGWSTCRQLTARIYILYVYIYMCMYTRMRIHIWYVYTYLCVYTHVDVHTYDWCKLCQNRGLSNAACTFQSVRCIYRTYVQNKQEKCT